MVRLVQVPFHEGMTDAAILFIMLRRRMFCMNEAQVQPWLHLS